MLERVPAWFVADSSPIVPHRFMETSRLEIFGDGVFAIAATLLVVRVSVNAPGGALGGALVHAWPQYAAYALSFRYGRPTRHQQAFARRDRGSSDGRRRDADRTLEPVHDARHH